MDGNNGNGSAMQSLMKKVVMALVVLLAASVCVNYMQCSNAKQGYRTDTVRIIKYRWLTKNEPQAKEEKPVGNVKVRIVTKRDTIRDTIPQLVIREDSTVEIPITQKVYEDSDYVAYVSGYQQNLDSIRIRQTEIFTTITKTKKQRWTFGLQGGAGIGVITRQPDIYIGFGASYNF